MAHYESRQHSELNVVEAIETLTSIADLEIDGPIAIAEKHEIELQELPIIYRTVHWLHRKNAEKVMVVVRDTFRVILNYLKYFYKREYGKLVQHQSVEGIKTIMVLVGEAAKKVDKYNRLFVGAQRASVPYTSIKDTKEFRELVYFYQKKIAPIAVHESLTKWMHMIPQQVVKEASQEQQVSPVDMEHLFIDLDGVKKDSEYELFLIRKEDGSRFFNPRLLRNIKLVCNFDEYFGQQAQVSANQVSANIELQVCKDLSCQLFARSILRHCWSLIDQFMKNGHKLRHNDLAMLVYNSLLALMLAANRGASHIEIIKSSGRYFYDFQKFLRMALASADYQRIVAYPPKDHDALSFKIIELVQSLCRQLFSSFYISQEGQNFINGLIIRGKEDMITQEAFTETAGPTISTKMGIDQEALTQAMRPYNHVPLISTLGVLHEGDITGFDPWMLQNLPVCLFDLYPKGKKVSVLRMAAPCTQEYIHKAAVSEEFKAYLRDMRANFPEHKHLLFNLQDRTQWKDFARCHALEEIQKKEEFFKNLAVVSLTKESTFYHQIGEYEEVNQSDLFIEHLLEHVQSENSGYFYPAEIKEKLFHGFTQELAAGILQLFFGGKNVLSRTNRMDFIELFYLFMQLKIVEWLQPTSISFSCKDAIDIGMPASCELFLALKVLNGRPLSAEEEEYLKLFLHGPAIFYRGRALFADRFNRLQGMIHVIEQQIEDKGFTAFHHDLTEHIAPLFDGEILSSVVTIPQPLI